MSAPSRTSNGAVSAATPLDGVDVRGAPTPDEFAAVLAALSRRPSTNDDPYERWRRGRIAALTRGTVAGPPPR